MKGRCLLGEPALRMLVLGRRSEDTASPHSTDGVRDLDFGLEGVGRARVRGGKQVEEHGRIVECAQGLMEGRGTRALDRAQTRLENTQRERILTGSGDSGTSGLPQWAPRIFERGC